MSQSAKYSTSNWVKEIKWKEIIPCNKYTRQTNHLTKLTFLSVSFPAALSSSPRNTFKDEGSQVWFNWVKEKEQQVRNNQSRDEAFTLRMIS